MASNTRLLAVFFSPTTTVVWGTHLEEVAHNQAMLTLARGPNVELVQYTNIFLLAGPVAYTAVSKLL